MTQLKKLPIATVRSLRTAGARLRLGGRLQVLGDGLLVGPGMFATRNARLTIGKRVGIGPRFTLMADLTIGDDVMISGNVSVVGNDHPFDESDRKLTDFAARPPAVVNIKGDNLIGFGSTIVGPLTINEGAVVAAGAVVVADVPANAVVAGVPAKVVRYRRSEEDG